MNIEVNLPQLDEMSDTLNNIDTVGATTASDIELLIKLVQALDKKLDTLALVVTSPGPVQLDLPLTDKPEAVVPASKTAKAPTSTRKGQRKAELITTTTVATGVTHAKSEIVEPAKVNSEDAVDRDDEDTQRARVAFEAKRVQRVFGIGAMRAAVRKVAGVNILNVDDVPGWQLLQLLGELQAL